MTLTSFAETDDNTHPILMWSGTLANIPEGYVLCDGQNGTPDMTDRFIKNLNSAGEQPYDGGGVDAHYLSESQLPSHSHSGSTTTDGSHSHTFDYGNNYHHMTGHYSGGSQEKYINGYSKSRNTSSTNDHSHNTSIDDTGSGSHVDNRPSYYQIAFITIP